MPYLLQGSLVTMALVVGAMGLGLVLGVILAVGLVYGSPYIRTVFNLYVWFFRGVPLLVLLFLFYFGLFTLVGINISAFSAAVIVLGLISAAYQSQIFRGGILSLPEGQLKAARALGMSDTKAIFFIILPQALRLVHPGMVQRVFDYPEGLGRSLCAWGGRSHGKSPFCCFKDLSASAPLFHGRGDLFDFDLPGHQSPSCAGGQSEDPGVHEMIRP